MSKGIRKVLISAIILTLAFTAAGCGQPQPGPIQKLLDDGYVCRMSTSNGNEWQGVFEKEDRAEPIYKVHADMSKRQLKALMKTDFMDEDFEEQRNAVIATFRDVTITDISDLVPDQQQLDSFAGMTLGQLEAAGFEYNGYMGDEDKAFYQFTYTNHEYEILVTLGDVRIPDIFDIHVSELRDTPISKAEFYCISSHVIELTTEEE